VDEAGAVERLAELADVDPGAGEEAPLLAEALHHAREEQGVRGPRWRQLK
jgi:hypothetical protein